MLNPAQAHRTINVKILRIARRDSGRIRAYVDIVIGNSGSSLKLSGIKIVQQEGQRPWVGMPDKEWVDKDGKKKYTPIIELSGHLKTAVEQAVLAAWEGGAR